MSSNKDILTKEIESWGWFEHYEKKTVLSMTLNRCRKSEYVSCVNAKGENFSAEALFLILILQQQKMINELIAKLRDMIK
jgi:hypothetical protein